MIKYFLLTLCCAFIYTGTFAQEAPCPTNLDFEENNYGYWVLSTGTCCPIVTPAVGQIINRHELTSGTGLDPYGGFPIVSPTGGTYSLKLGNDDIGSQSEKASYFVHVPASITNYNLIFHYAVVFQDPGHDPSEQPRFEVKAYDSISGNPLPCASFTFIADEALPGFQNSPGQSDVKFKPWTTASVNLTGYQGQTVIVEFATGDCSLGAHFGYGYLDLNCSLFAIDNLICDIDDPYYFTAPPGYADYVWYDANFSNILGYGQQFSFPTIPNGASLNVILVPYPGFGCPDTLTAQNPEISISQSEEFITICEPETYKGHGTTGVYYDTLINAKGCDSLVTLNLIVENLGCKCKFTIPNAFSPNNDLKNDIFRPVFKCLIEPISYKLSIYNRWGQEVFSTADYKQGWNGKNNGEPYDIGTYMYHLEYINPYSLEKIVKNGDVTLVK